jgi:hypothetical protein
MFPLSYLDKRSTAKEYLDMPDMTDDDILDSFSFIQFVNRWGGGHRGIRTALATALGSWPRERRLEILDVGCGTGDMAKAVSEWGKDSGFSIRYKGIDRNSRIIKLAEARTKIEGIEYSQGDLFDRALPQADIIIASMVFHHFAGGEIEKAIGHLLTKSRHALIINDLTRSFSLYSICYLLTRFVKSEVSRNDALLSVRKGFRVEEMRTLLDKLNIRGTIKKQFCGRFSVIIFKKPGS